MVLKKFEKRFLTQPMFVAEQFTGRPGVFVKVADTVRGCQELLAGQHDDLPEMAFYMAGGIEDVIAKAAELRAAA